MILIPFLFHIVTTMTSRNIYKRLGYRYAEEIQLIAEEIWIIEALNKIKKQRNSLQIERLQLESLKAQLNSNVTTDAGNRKKTNDENPVISTIDLMQNSHSGTLDNKPLHPNENEVLCNKEELSLLVTTPMLSRPPLLDNNIEEDDSDEDDNVFIDINMLMNGIESDENLE